MKETIAKALEYPVEIDVETVIKDTGNSYWTIETGQLRTSSINELTDLVIKALSEEPPVDIDECLLSDEEMLKIISKELGYEEDSIDLVGIEKEVAKAQLQKVAPYIEAVKKAERIRIASVLEVGAEIGDISKENMIAYAKRLRQEVNN